MRRAIESTPGKIAAVILSYVMVLVFVLSAVATFLMGYYKFYFSDEDTVKQEIMTDMAENEAIHASQLWYWSSTDMDKYYSDKNVFYKIYDIRNDKTYTNYGGEDYIASGTYDYTDWFSKSEVDPETGEEIWYTEEEIVANVEIYVARDMTKSDMFSVVLKIIEWGFKFEYAVIFIMLLSLIAAIVLWCYLFCAAGHKPGGIVAANYLDKVPFDIYTAAVTVAAVFSIIIVSNFSYDFAETTISLFLVGTVDYFIGLLYLLSFATRLKTKTLLRNNIIYFILAFFARHFKRFYSWLKYVFSNLNLIYKTAVVLAGVIFLEFIAVIIGFNAFYYLDPVIFIIILVYVNILLILGALYLSVVLQKIKIGGEKIAGGELEHKIDTAHMIGDFKRFSESLNNINDGLQNAVNEKMKSERFKTELITNVSHDIKTPLTSIVNYVDLINKENCDNEKINEYIEVLNRQSSRLKKLVEDLVEASKASTGNLSVNLMPCDVGVLLNQTVGEFEDRLKKAGVEPVVNSSEEPVRIMADGRHLWRVFDNLMNNVCKYALTGTRVYLDVKNQNGRAVITFRNISRYSLNISADELMERFVRGDSSRNTEGSGLGLSIAKSLVELQNGSMDLSVDGDLFKVTLNFPVIK